MVFWKKLFNNSDTVATSEATELKGELLTVNTVTNSEAQILFSTERDIDLYELEELCDRVGWARRPLRKVKKAIHHSFLVISMVSRRAISPRKPAFRFLSSPLDRHGISTFSPVTRLLT